MVTPIRQAH